MGPSPAGGRPGALAERHRRHAAGAVGGGISCPRADGSSPGTRLCCPWPFTIPYPRRSPGTARIAVRAHCQPGVPWLLVWRRSAAEPGMAANDGGPRDLEIPSGTAGKADIRLMLIEAHCDPQNRPSRELSARLRRCPRGGVSCLSGSGQGGAVSRLSPLPRIGHWRAAGGHKVEHTAHFADERAARAADRRRKTQLVLRSDRIRRVADHW